MEKSWQDVPLTIIVPYGEGGGADVSARQLARFWGEELDTEIVVENHPGKAGRSGTSHFLSLPDDGCFVLLSAQVFFSLNILFQNAPYAIDDISVLSFLELDRDCLSVSVDSPYRTIAELSSAILENPNRFSVPDSLGVPANIILDYLIEKYHWQINRIPCEGAAARQQALADGVIDFCVGGMITALRNNERCLMIYRNERHPMLPDVPGLGEVLGESVPALGTSRFVAVRSTLRKKHPERFQMLIDTLHRARQRNDYQEVLKQSLTHTISVYINQENSDRMLREMHETVAEYKKSLDPQ